MYSSIQYMSGKEQIYTFDARISMDVKYSLQLVCLHRYLTESC
nr:MAG TPA: hypothetical protein [Caudoviricetes sp.]